MHIDYCSFGDGSLTALEEDLVLGYFACYVVFHPRNGSGQNTKMYADTNISAVRATVIRRYKRRPGSAEGKAYGLKQVLKGLAKAAPGGVRRVAQPIMQTHLRRIRDWLDLENNQVMAPILLLVFARFPHRCVVHSATVWSGLFGSPAGSS
jgi:hypothetical protein